jgi:hypothetical protein
MSTQQVTAQVVNDFKQWIEQNEHGAVAVAAIRALTTVSNWQMNVQGTTCGSDAFIAVCILVRVRFHSLGKDYFEQNECS